MNIIENATVEDLNIEAVSLHERFGILERFEDTYTIWIERVSDSEVLVELDTEEQVLTMFY